MRSENVKRNKKEIFDFIKDYINKNQYPPSIREITKSTNVKSTSTVHKYLSMLEADKCIEIDRGIGRGIKIVKKRRVKI